MDDSFHGRLPPVVVGSFYPDDPAVLARAVDDHLDAGRPRAAGHCARVIVAPHAGYPYSGPIAGTAFAALDLAGVRRVVIIGPSHYVAFNGIALPSADRLATPLGDVPIDLEAARSLLAASYAHVRPHAFAQEHSIEVELPFLQRLDQTVAVVPLIVGRASATTVADVLDAVWDDHTAIVVSSDLSHFLDYDAAQREDGATAAAIRSLDATLRPEQACGAAAINGLLVLVRRRGWRVDALDLRSSGDTAGDRERVVGYGAFAFSRA